MDIDRCATGGAWGGCSADADFDMPISDPAIDVYGPTGIDNGFLDIEIRAWAGNNFAFRIVGWDLRADDQVRIVDENIVCGDANSNLNSVHLRDRLADDPTLGGTGKAHVKTCQTCQNVDV